MIRIFNNFSSQLFSGFGWTILSSLLTLVFSLIFGVLLALLEVIPGARSTGMTYKQAMRYVILPQAFKIVIPPLGNQFVNLIKDSSILAFVAGFDLMYQANAIASVTFDTFNSYFVIGVLYLIITMPLSYYMQYLEKKMA